MLKHLRNQHGQAMIAMGITLIVFFGLVAVAVDFGRVAHAVNELQIAADSGATAGATTLFNGNGANDPQSAGAQSDSLTAAEDIAEQNYVNGHLAQGTDI